MINFFVPGIPAPQGSKTPWGTEANPRTRPWREAVKYAAIEAMRDAGQSVFTGPVAISLHFQFPRPKSHYNSKGQLKPVGIAQAYKGSKPDIDKLCRAVNDALTDAGVWRDDSLVCFAVLRKDYGEPAGVAIIVQCVEEFESEKKNVL